MKISEEDIIAFCEALKERMIRESSNDINIEVHHNAHYAESAEAELIGETISIRFGDGPEISY
jgi:hypothetical protein